MIVVRRRKREHEPFVLGSPLVGPRFERIAQRFRGVVDRAEAIECAIASAETNEDFATVDALEAELAKLDRVLRRVWRELSRLRFETMSTEKTLPRLLTLEEIVKLTGRSRRSLYVDISLGRLKTTKLGRSVRVIEADYVAYVEAGRRP